MEPQRVLIVDDHPVVRRGISALLEDEPWVGEVAEAATVEEAVKEAVSRQVNVIAMDIALPDGDGIDATRRILQRRPEVKVLMVTLTEDEDTVERALRAGARGYVLKDTDPDAVVDALRAVAGGGLVLGPKVGPAMLTTLRRAPAALPAPFDQLTPRERDILAGLARGEANAQIARHLGVGEKTIRNQLTTVFAKLNVADRTNAVLRIKDAGVEGMLASWVEPSGRPGGTKVPPR
jgi:two-component system nitrate/nitrite response regulator NarL